MTSPAPGVPARSLWDEQQLRKQEFRVVLNKRHCLSCHPEGGLILSELDRRGFPASSVNPGFTKLKTDIMSEIKEKVKQYLLEELNLPVKAEELNNGTPLLSSRLIDSISALLLVEYLEKTFQIQFQPHEVNNDNLDTLDLIEAFVQGKQ